MIPLAALGSLAARRLQQKELHVAFIDEIFQPRRAQDGVVPREAAQGDDGIVGVQDRVLGKLLVRGGHQVLGRALVGLEVLEQGCGVANKVLRRPPVREWPRTSRRCARLAAVPDRRGGPDGWSDQQRHHPDACRGQRQGRSLQARGDASNHESGDRPRTENDDCRTQPGVPVRVARQHLRLQAGRNRQRHGQEPTAPPRGAVLPPQGDDPDPDQRGDRRGEHRQIVEIPVSGDAEEHHIG